MGFDVTNFHVHGLDGGFLTWTRGMRSVVAVPAGV